MGTKLLLNSSYKYLVKSVKLIFMEMKLLLTSPYKYLVKSAKLLLWHKN